MDIFYQNKVLVRLVLGLVLINLGILVFVWLNRHPDRPADRQPGPPKRDRSEISALLKEKLDLSPQQEQALKDLREDFFNREASLSKTIRSQRDSMNIEMFQADTDTVQVRQIAWRLANNEFRMEMYRFEQAQAMKRILTPQQTDKMEELVLEIRDYFQPEKKEKR